MKTIDGKPATEDYGHVGWPSDPEAALETLRRGLPAYWPTDPALSLQRPYREFAAIRGPNSE